MTKIRNKNRERKKPTILTISQKAETVEYKNTHPGEKAVRIAPFSSKKFKIKFYTDRFEII